MTSNIAYNLVFLINDIHHHDGLSLKYYENNITHTTFDNIIDLIKFRNSNNLTEIRNAVYYFEFIYNNKLLLITYNLNNYFEISEKN